MVFGVFRIYTTSCGKQPHPHLAGQHPWEYRCNRHSRHSIHRWHGCNPSKKWQTTMQESLPQPCNTTNGMHGDDGVATTNRNQDQTL